MLKQSFLFLLALSTSCNTGKLKFINDLPNDLKEVSGTEIIENSNVIWMLNDSGNKPLLYSLNTKGEIISELKINAKNHDWEDLTSDSQGNLYIGDFGNNNNKRDNLAILKVNKTALKEGKKVDVERISFKFKNQTKFPPKKKKMFFDCEAFFHYNDSLYLFTKSRVKNNFGKTNLYKLPATKGNHVAELVGSFNTCNESDCWITSADISNDGKQMVLLTPKSVWVFSNFKGDDFFNGDVTEIPFDYISQKEGICFKDNNTLLITDEKAHGEGGNLYKLSLN
ncbi:hypothetical protein BWZ22_09315 [Seonamhaeicola sp. S2-3]|uniref:hypothetical protein n=1 Tax=Seonamhaeicola sp. S2-3 TaxID=1936081 RepID=UPI0009728BCE|nr:hypothetical protein [Seonamhaeicola sp. S2-3]APY11432.1 hypothetical protein BWZ22_09315 [Seonamhaeicola sp. S2-3]